MISEILLKRGIFKQCIYSSKSTIKYYNKSYPLKTSLDLLFGCLRLGGLHIFWWIHKDTSKFLQTKRMKHVSYPTTHLHDVKPNSGTEQTTLAVIMTLECNVRESSS